MVKKKRTLDPLPLFDEPSLISFLEQNGLKTTHARTIWKHVIRNPGTSFSEIPSIPSVLKEGLLESNFAITTSKVIQANVSSDGSTIKLLIELQDGLKIESVIICHENSFAKRNTLCVSSQVGCQMGCTFCATGTMGLEANLTAGEICEQLVHALKYAPIRNIVFMGMGEPLENYHAVLNAIVAMTDHHRFGLSKNTITLSTVGVVPKIKQLTRDAPYVQLAVSLHASNEDIRRRIVPSSSAFPLNKIIEAIDDHLEQVKRRVLIEYVMIKGINDSEESAHELGKLLQDRDLIVNLIPYNPTAVKEIYEPPEDSVTIKFRDIVHSYGLLTTIRQHHGRDIDGACGQLALKSCNDSSNEAKLNDIEDLLKIQNQKKKGK